MSATMTQCVLRSDAGVIDPRWIDTKLAVVGKRVRVKATGEWWTVVERGATWPEARVLDYERDYVTMKTVTDAFTGRDGKRILPVKPH
jgi:hypothetical protein